MGKRSCSLAGRELSGPALTDSLTSAGYTVVVLSRCPNPPGATIPTVVWDGRSRGDWTVELEGAVAVVNLASRSIACVHTPENRREILISRLAAVRAGLEQCRSLQGQAVRAPARIAAIA